MGHDVGSRIIAAFAAGQRERLLEQQRAQQAEDRKIQRELLMHEKKRLDIQDKLAARAAQFQAGQFLEGRKGPVLQPTAEEAAPMPTQGASVGTPSVNLPQGPGGPGPAQVSPAGQVQLQGSSLPGLQAQEISHPTTNLQAIPEIGIPETAYTPLNESQTREKAMRDIMLEIQAKNLEAKYGPQKFTSLAPGAGTFNTGTGEVGVKPTMKPDVLSPEAEAQKIRISKAGKTTINATQATNDARDTAQAIMDGKQPPTLQGLYRNTLAVRGEMARAGYDLATAQKDWMAVTKHISTLNGQQQERLRQAITFTYESLDIIDQLYGDWVKTGLPGGFSDYNKAALTVASRLPGEAGATARALQAQINDLVSEMATVYKGGNSSTDEGLRLAAANLKADWNPATFKKAMGLLRKNLLIRRNSIYNSEPVGVSQGSVYGGQGTGTPPPGAGGPPAGAVGIAPGSDGQQHYHDAQGNDLGVAP